MSMPNIPDITPDIKLKRKDVVNLLLASIAMEELGLAHLINAEGEKLQKVIKHARNIDDLLEANKSVEKMLKTIIKKEMLLQFKMEEVLEIPEEEHEDHRHEHEEESSSSSSDHKHPPPPHHHHKHHHHEKSVEKPNDSSKHEEISRSDEKESIESSDHKHHDESSSDESITGSESTGELRRRYKTVRSIPPGRVPPGRYKRIPRKNRPPK